MKEWRWYAKLRSLPLPSGPPSPKYIAFHRALTHTEAGCVAKATSWKSPLPHPSVVDAACLPGRRVACSPWDCLVVVWRARKLTAS